jgi:tartrate dehydrogenase/decarboxylase/D-malate dehydrogenase
MSHTHRIAAIPGDGIGKEVMPEALRVLDAASRRYGFALELRHVPWASCDHFAQHGQMMPDDWKAQLQPMDALLFGAVGWPATVPDHVSLWGSLLKFRREFDQYINLRPARLFEGVPCPLAGPPARRHRHADRAREHRGRVHQPRRRDVRRHRARVRDAGVGVQPPWRRARAPVCLRARRRAPRRTLTAATKSNGIAISMPWWDKVVDAVHAHYPQVSWSTSSTSTS